MIDDHLASLGLLRNIAARCPHFGLIPAMVADSLLVLTTGRQYCERFVDTLPVQILPCPVAFPRMMYYQLWHERTHASTPAAGCASRSRAWPPRCAAWSPTPWSLATLPKTATA